ncbi:MAG: hypothetical protein IKL92_04940 [Oscillospiraceae bacterium]|nr:hypothetical protein [Oscillospiraceae bacterium]
MLVAVITAGLAFLGTAVGAYYSNQKTTALVVYRLEQLEEKVNKHNNVIERTYMLEKAEEVIEEKIKVANRRITDLESFHK